MRAERIKWEPKVAVIRERRDAELMGTPVDLELGTILGDVNPLTRPLEDAAAINSIATRLTYDANPREFEESCHPHSLKNSTFHTYALQEQDLRLCTTCEETTTDHHAEAN